MRSRTESLSSGRTIQKQTDTAVGNPAILKQSRDAAPLKVKEKERRETIVQSSGMKFEGKGQSVFAGYPSIAEEGIDDGQPQQRDDHEDAHTQVNDRAMRKEKRRVQAFSLGNDAENRRAIAEMNANASERLTSPQRAAGPRRRAPSNAGDMAGTSSISPRSSEAVITPAAPTTQQVQDGQVSKVKPPPGSIQLPFVADGKLRLRSATNAPQVVTKHSASAKEASSPDSQAGQTSLRSTKSEQDLPGSSKASTGTTLRQSNVNQLKVPDTKAADIMSTSTAATSGPAPLSPRSPVMESVEQYSARMSISLPKGDHQFADSFGRNDPEEVPDLKASGRTTPRSEKRATTGSAKSSPPPLPTIQQDPLASSQASPMSPRGLRREQKDRDFRCLQLLGRINQNGLPEPISPDFNVELKKRVKPLTNDDKSLLISSAVAALTDDGMFDQGEQGFLLRAVLIRSAHFAALDLANLLAS